MAYDKVVDSAVLDAGLKQVADAIREKGGTSDSLAFPTAMVEAIAAIQAGGGGDDQSFKEVIERTATNPTLPSDLTSIGDYAFRGCRTLSLTSLPSGITSIGNLAFENCTNLTNITFKGKPSAISSAAFDGCTNLLTINVPWAEGEVAGAPWGATNATINYNYTEG